MKNSIILHGHVFVMVNTIGSASSLVFGSWRVLCPGTANVLSSREIKRFAYAKTKVQISFAVTAKLVTAKLISAFVFAAQIHVVQSLYFLNQTFQASSHLL